MNDQRHFCPEWDFMEISNNNPEFDSCLCFKDKKIAALFVEIDSVYKKIDFIDCYDKERNAMNYRGDYPVVAHPPCQLWGKMAKINYLRWGGDHNKPGNDGGCFEFALNSVNRCSGVLEHPAQTYAWKEFGLDKPDKNCWKKSGLGWVCEVWQSAYGHKANKSTWIYFVGNKKPYDLDWSKPKGAYQIGFQDRRGKKLNKPTLSKKEANSTPILFRDELIKLCEYSIN